MDRDEGRQQERMGFKEVANRLAHAADHADTTVNSQALQSLMERCTHGRGERQRAGGVMTPDLYRRTEALEQRMTIAEEQRRQLKESVDRVEAKVDELLQAAAMGKGAWFVIVKIGGVIVIVGYLAMWLADHFKLWAK